MIGRSGKSMLIGAAILAQVGCGSEVEPFEEGSLEVRWDVAPMGCELSEVETVEAVLENERRSYDRQVPCEASTLLFRDVKAGSYELRLTGIDIGGQPSFGAGFEDVMVRPDERKDLGWVDLTALTSRVDVEWYFENQRVCGTNGVEEVELTVFDEAYYEVFRDRARCDDGMLNVEELRAGEYLFRARAFAGETRYEGVSEQELKRGGESRVEVSLVNISDLDISDPDDL